MGSNFWANESVGYITTVSDLNHILRQDVYFDLEHQIMVLVIVNSWDIICLNVINYCELAAHIQHLDVD